MNRLESRDFFGMKIAPISRRNAMEIVVSSHYLHRKCPASFCFGLFKGLDILGVIVYGTPSSSPLRKGICGVEEAGNVIELTRLWVDDSVPANGESFLIGNTLSLIDKEIVVSFADTSMSHLGVVYQATNWIYTGLSAKRTNWTIEGIDLHCQTLADKYTSKEIRAFYGEKFCLKERSRKHRYIYINARSKKRKKELIEKLRYPSLPYPKHQAEAEVSHD